MMPFKVLEDVFKYLKISLKNKLIKCNRIYLFKKYIVIFPFKFLSNHVLFLHTLHIIWKIYFPLTWLMCLKTKLQEMCWSAWKKKVLNVTWHQYNIVCFKIYFKQRNLKICGSVIYIERKCKRFMWLILFFCSLMKYRVESDQRSHDVSLWRSEVGRLFNEYVTKFRSRTSQAASKCVNFAAVWNKTHAHRKVPLR